jgi:hypothetical protein
VLATITRSGQVHVTEQLPWPSGQATVELAAPATADLTGAAAEARPRVEDLAVDVDGRPADLTTRAGGWQVGSGDHASRLAARYRLAGAMLHSTGPDVPKGRALAVLTPVLPRPPAACTARVEGQHLLSVVCLMPGSAAPQLCAHQHDGGWNADVPTGSAGVLLVQLDLTPTSS